MQGVVQAIESLKNPEWFIWVQVAGVIIIPIVLSLALLCQNNKNNKNNEKLLLFGDFLGKKHPELLRERMPLCLKNTGGSLWLRKK